MFQLQSQVIIEVATALAKAQGKFPPIPKSKTATVRSAKGDYSYNYADISDVLAAVRPVLSSEGLALLQAVETSEQGRMQLKTMLVHGASGQFIGSVITLRSGGGPQDLGSELSYNRRYSATALLGVAAEEDDDGSRAQEAATASRQGQPRQPQAPNVNRKPDPRPTQNQPKQQAAPGPWVFPASTPFPGKRPEEVGTVDLTSYLALIQGKMKEANITAAHLTPAEAEVFNAVGAEMLKRRKAEAQAMAAQPEPLVRTDSLVDDFASFDGRR